MVPTCSTKYCTDVLIRSTPVGGAGIGGGIDVGASISFNTYLVQYLPLTWQYQREAVLYLRKVQYLRTGCTSVGVSS